jgi:hypothetical protein
MGTPIFGPRRFIVAWISGAFFPIANGSQARSIDTSRRHILLGSIGTTFTKGQIIGIGTTLVTMSFNLSPYRGILIHEGHFPIEGRACISTQIVLIEVKRDILILEICGSLAAELSTSATGAASSRARSARGGG